MVFYVYHYLFHDITISVLLIATRLNGRNAFGNHVGRMADAVIEGKMMRKDVEEEVVVETRSTISRRIDEDEELDDEMLLGDATRAKIVYEHELETEAEAPAAQE